MTMALFTASRHGCAAGRHGHQRRRQNHHDPPMSATAIGPQSGPSAANAAISPKNANRIGRSGARRSPVRAPGIAGGEPLACAKEAEEDIHPILGNAGQATTTASESHPVNPAILSKVTAAGIGAARRYDSRGRKKVERSLLCFLNFWPASTRGVPTGGRKGTFDFLTHRRGRPRGRRADSK